MEVYHVLNRSPMLNLYIKFNKITTELAENLIIYRNSYNYPNVRLVATDQPTIFKISNNLWALPDESAANKPTDLALDEYHNNLLNSSNPDENLLGTASIIFWGFYTFKTNYALNKLHWHLEGHKNKQPATAFDVSNRLTQARNEKDPGRALLCLSDISQLGSIPFASKVIAFLKPNTTGIYDNQIHKGLIDTDWYITSGIETKIGEVRNKSVQRGYTKWCELISKIADELNSGINAGNDWKWRDPSTGTSSLWRAIDVERALFNHFKKTRNNNTFI